MSKTIDFSFPGGFPLDQDSLGFMQDAMLQILRAFYKNLLLPDSGKFILSGVNPVGLTSLDDGWVTVEGELLPVIGGTGLYLQLVENTTSATFQDNTSHPVYIERYMVKSLIATDNIHYTDFHRLNGHRMVTPADCIHLADRTYKYVLPHVVGSIETDGTGNSTSGFILNRIEPFEDIRNGHELIIRLGDGTGLTPMTKMLTESNIRFLDWQHSRNHDGDPDGLNTKHLRPVFGNSSFIGSSGSSITTGVGYDRNVFSKLVWSSKDSLWYEVHRGSNYTVANSI